MSQVSMLLRNSVWKVALLLGVFALLFLSKALLVPLVVAALLALMLNPVHQWALDLGWSNTLATSVSMLVLLIFFGGLFAAIGTQGARFVENLPSIQERVYNKYQDVKDQLASAGGAKVESQKQVKDSDASGGSTSDFVSGSQAADAVSKILGVLGNFMLMLVYVALMLSQKERLRNFIIRRTPEDQQDTTHKTINETVKVAQQYLRGRLILIGILTVLYSVGFLIVGLEYAIVIAVLAATLSIIPYIGNIIGGLIALALAMTSGADNMSQQIYGIIITMSVAQTLESYVLTPLIVGKEVSINSLTTIIAVVGFNVLWGPVGAIVAIPIVAMARILFQHVESLQDYAYLLGND